MRWSKNLNSPNKRNKPWKKLDKEALKKDILEFPDSYYRFKELYENGGEEALQEISRKKPILANRVEPHVEKAVIDMAISEPAFGQLRVSNELKKQGVIVSPSGVRSIWLRNELNNFKQRLKALEAKSAQDGILLTESQLAALEKTKKNLRHWVRLPQSIQDS